MLISVQLHTRLSSKIAFVGHSSSPVKAVTTALPSPDRAKNKQKNPKKQKKQFHCTVLIINLLKVLINFK